MDGEKPSQATGRSDSERDVGEADMKEREETMNGATRPQQDGFSPPSDGTQSAAAVAAPAQSSAASAAPILRNPTLFVGNLHPKIARIHLEKLLDKFGSVERIHIVANKGFAFCEFARPSQAQAAMKQLHGRTLLGRRLAVRPANERSQSASGPRQVSASAAATPTSLSRERQQVEDKIKEVKRKLYEAQRK